MTDGDCHAQLPKFGPIATGTTTSAEVLRDRASLFIDHCKHTSHSAKHKLSQGRNEVRWRPHVRNRVFGSKCTVLKKILVTLFGLFGAFRSHSAPPAVILRSYSDSAPGELCPPCPPRYAPAISTRCWTFFSSSCQQLAIFVKAAFIKLPAFN